jgi:predicted dehydrogenase
MKTVAVIGCGKRGNSKEGWAIGHAHARGYLECGHPVKLIGVDISPENLKAFGETFGLPTGQLFSSTEAMYAAGIPDCVSICTWPELHHPLVIEALEKGVKGIACEKPFTLDVGEQRDIEKRVADSGAILVIAHQRRLEAAFRKLKEVATSGKLGLPLKTEGHVGDDWDILSWTTHWFDMANFFFDGPPEFVLAGMDLDQKRRYRQAVEDASVVFAFYGKAGSGVFVTGPGKSHSFSVQGPGGIAKIGDGVIEVATFEAGAEKVPFDTPARAGFACLMKELIEALDGGAEPMCSIRRSALATEMAYAAHESARTGRKVAIPFDKFYAPLEIHQHPSKSSLEGKQLILYADSHFNSGGREGIAEAFGKMTNRPMKVLDAESSELTAADLEGVDAVLLYHTQKEPSPATMDALTAWVKARKPLFVIHAALGAWPEWEEYKNWCGKIWKWGESVHPHEPAPLKVADGDPMQIGWSEAWLPRDEVFVKLADISPITVGVTTDISIGTYEVAWRNKEFPNVGVWMPGHRKDSWSVPAMCVGAERVLAGLMRA